MNYSDPRRVPAINPLPSDDNDNEMRTRRVRLHQDVHPIICCDDLHRSTESGYHTHSPVATTTFIEEHTEQTRPLPSRYMCQQDVEKRENSDDARMSFAYPTLACTAPTHTQVRTAAISTGIDDGGDNSNIPPAYTQSPFSPFSGTTDATYIASDQMDEPPMSKPKMAKVAKKKKKEMKSSMCKPESFKVQHDYHDYSRISYEKYEECHPNMKRPRLMKCMTPFPRALHNILEEASTHSIISWCPHGRAFQIHNKNAFVYEIMPRHFSQSKFTSFQRQLNIYSFRRLTKGPDTDAYYHELFLRGRIELCQAMCRHKIKGTKHKASNNPENEPNFYALPFVDNSTVVDDSTDKEIDANVDADNDFAPRTTGAAVGGVAPTDPGYPRTPYTKKPTFTLNSAASIVTPTSPSSKKPGPDDMISELQRILVGSDASVGTIPVLAPHEDGTAASTYTERVTHCNNEVHNLTLPFNTQDLEQDLLQLPLIDDVPREIMSSEDKVGENETFQDFEW